MFKRKNFSIKSSGYDESKFTPTVHTSSWYQIVTIEHFEQQRYQFFFPTPHFRWKKTIFRWEENHDL